MASSKIFMIMVLVALVYAPSTLSATEFVVGDEAGWNNIGFDYQIWAQGKEFHVGDKLVFKYNPGVHNVIKVNGTGFQQCLAPAGSEALTSGNDVITLASPGRKWYICGIADHCVSGNQKLVITVLAQWGSPSPSPSANPPSSSAAAYIAPRYYGWVAATVLVVLGMVMV